VTQARSRAEPAPDASRAVRRVRGSLAAEVRERLRRAIALAPQAQTSQGLRFETARRLITVTGALYRWYFRTECHGIEHLPEGPVMLVANHGSHVLAWDGANVVSACLLDAEPPRLVCGMAHHRLMELPILGWAARRIGAVDGRRDTCVALLRAGAAVLTFPEGTNALIRPFRDRYRVEPFGHGFLCAALAANAPIVPVAVIGCEEEAPILANPPWLRRLLGTPTAGLTPTIVLPLPVRYRLHFGTPIVPSGPPTPDNVGAQVERVRGALARLIDVGRAARRHVFV
jgi:1-acyl-sn-glycerol-3-phosphate acyltransferase